MSKIQLRRNDKRISFISLEEGIHISFTSRSESVTGMKLQEIGMPLGTVPSSSLINCLPIRDAYALKQKANYGTQEAVPFRWEETHLPTSLHGS